MNHDFRDNVHKKANIRVKLIQIFSLAQFDTIYFFSFQTIFIYFLKYILSIMLLWLFHFSPFALLHQVSPFPPAIPPLVHVHGSCI